MNKFRFKINQISVLFFVLFLAVSTSCTTLKVGIDLLLLDFDGEELIENEPQVRDILETILFTPEQYTLTAYTRQVFSPELKRTPSRYHSFYVITDNEIPFNTLSFSGTKKRMRSKGAWVINTEPDVNSYTDFKYGTNKWDVQKIPISNGINTEMTIKNIVHRIDNDVNYYYNDHRKDKKGMENCNSALKNTLVKNN